MQIMEVLRPSDGGKTLFRDAIPAFVQIPHTSPPSTVSQSSLQTKHLALPVDEEDIRVGR